MKFDTLYNEIMNEDGKCKGSCIKHIEGKWRIVSAKTGKLWPAKYDSREKALEALKAYQFHKHG